MKGFSKRWLLFLPLALVAGLLLRTTFLEDMEYKEDEHYNFIQSQLIGRSLPWPWKGMPSGVYIPNPGMSIWVFVWLARITGAHDPVSLQRAVGIFAVLGISLLIPFAFRFLQHSRREIALWAFALAMVNPFLVFYQRKLWPQPFLPFFSMLMLMGWWKKEYRAGAFVWGLMGALLGQIHMSGFFFAGAFFLFTALLDRRTRWGSWLIGSVLGALPLIPWFLGILSQPPSQRSPYNWGEVIQLKFWVFWVTDALGFHLGNPLGLLRGGSHWAQLSDFVRYPIIAGYPTYINGLAHLGVLLIGLWFLRRIFKNALAWLRHRPPPSRIKNAENAALWGFGTLLTLSGANIRRYYMNVSFPFELIWLVRAIGLTDRNRKILALLWIMQLIISASFVGYIHVNGGSKWGDYGEAFHVIRDRNLQTIGKPWPEDPPPGY